MKNLIRIIIMLLCLCPIAKADWIEVPSYVRKKVIVDNSCYSSVEIEDYYASIPFKGKAQYKSARVKRKDTLHLGKDANLYFRNLLNKNLQIKNSTTLNTLFVHLTEYVLYRSNESGYFQCAMDCYVKDADNSYRFVTTLDTSIIIPEREMVGLEIATVGNEVLLQTVAKALRTCPSSLNPPITFTALKANRDSLENAFTHFNPDNYSRGLYASWDDLFAKNPFEKDIQSTVVQVKPYNNFDFFRLNSNHKKISNSKVLIYHSGKQVYYRNNLGFHEVEFDSTGIHVPYERLTKVDAYYKKNNIKKSAVTPIVGGAVGGFAGAAIGAGIMISTDVENNVPLRAKLNPVSKKLLIAYDRR